MTVNKYVLFMFIMLVVTEVFCIFMLLLVAYDSKKLVKEWINKWIEERQTIDKLKQKLREKQKITVIRKYFNECSDEELIDLYYASEFCEANCPIADKCDGTVKDFDCLKTLKKHGLKEVE